MDEQQTEPTPNEQILLRKIEKLQAKIGLMVGAMSEMELLIDDMRERETLRASQAAAAAVADPAPSPV